jgi:hypothetical protein
VTSALAYSAGPDRLARIRGRVEALLVLLLLALALPCRAAEQSTAAPTELGEEPILSAGPLEYRPGRGLRVGSTGLVIGGFTEVKVEDTQAAGGESSLDLLNFFLIYDFSPRFRAVAELQLRDIFLTNKEQTGTQDFAFDVRRLFGDYTIADALRVRVGTFLTPVGYWNLLLAPPLTWTTEAPLIVEETFFEPTTTGVMVYGSTGVGPGQLSYSLFSQVLHPLQHDPDLDPPNYTAGLRLTYDLGPAWTGGATYQAAQNHSEWSQLGAVHLLGQLPRVQLLSELYVQGGGLPDSPDAHATQWGTYLQGVLEVYDPFFLVGRYEHFDPPAPDPTLNLFTVGAVCKPFPFMALKVEYRFVDRDVEADPIAGFFASFTTFF